LSSLPARAAATTAALYIMAPAYAVPLTFSSTDERVQRAVDKAGDCVHRMEVEKLRALPTGEIAAPLDITPAILVHTPHRAIASGHHRNVTGMRDVVRLFMLPTAQGAEIIAARHVDYVVVCPGAPESIRYAYRGPRGLSAMLAAGTPPQWLEPVPVPGLRALRVWRVRKDLLPPPAGS
jgi:hypothetical protein